MKGEKLQVFWGQRPYGAENSLSSGVICGLYSQGRKPDFFFKFKSSINNLFGGRNSTNMYFRKEEDISYIYKLF